MDKDSTQRLFGIRGAAGAENTADSIADATEALCAALFSRNSLAARDIVSVHFTLTRDLTALNPATAIRNSSELPGIDRIALFCSQEAYIAGGMDGIVRVLVTAYLPHDAEPAHVYIRGAERLRPDISPCG
ncbi:MAG: chorismate mutase [Treponema sp.]|nr:chorismate mutase [Treponema sp.]